MRLKISFFFFFFFQIAHLHAAPFAYLTNFAGNSLSIIDIATNTVVGSEIPVGSGPIAVAMSPSGQRAYITNVGSDSVSVFDLATNTVIDTIAVGDGPIGCVVNSAGTFAYVANGISGTVSVIDLSTNTTVHTVIVGDTPEGLAITPDATRVFVANINSHNVSVIETAGNTVEATVSVGTAPTMVAVNSAGTFAYVSNAASDNVSVIDISSNTVVSTIPTGGDNPVGIVINAAGTRAYVANANSDNVSILDLVGNTVLATVTVGDLPRGISITPAGNRLYVSNFNSDNVSVIDIATRSVIATIAVGDAPFVFGNFITPVPVGNFSTAPLDYGNQEVLTTSAPQTVTLTNEGNLALTFTSFTVTGDFAQTNDCGTSLAVSASCTISITFTPATVGSKTGVLTVQSDDPASPYTISLSGVGVAAPPAPVSTQYQGSDVLGCSLSAQNSNTASVLWIFSLPLFVFFVRRFKNRFQFLTVLFLMSLFSFSVHALDSSFSNESFRPATDDSDYFTLYSSSVLRKNHYHLGGYFDYFRNPVQLGNSANFNSISSINSDVIVGHFLGSYSPLNRLSVGASLPVYLLNSIKTATQDESAVDLGDFELNAKFNLLNSRKSPMGISFLAYALLPTATHTRDHFTGNGSFGGGALLILDSQVHSRVSLGLNTGVEIKDSFTNVDGNKYASKLLLNAGIAYDVIPKKLKLIAENQVKTELNDFFTRVNSPMEAHLGLRYRMKNGLNFDLGAGLGYRTALTSPDFRIFAGSTYTKGRIDEFKLPVLPEDEFSLDEKEWSELQLGEELKLKDKIYFDYNQSSIRDISKPTLNKLALFLKKHVEFKKLRIEGHTCDLGGKDYNLKLSQRRAESVKSYLVDQGVSDERLSAVGRGMEEPLVPNSDDFHREQNRRASIFVESK